MPKKYWTEEEINYLEGKWGEAPISAIAKKLGRTTEAIILKSKRLGLGSAYKAGEYLNATTIAGILKVDAHTVTDYWIGKCGLIARKKALNKFQVWMVKHNNLLKWLEENQVKWDSRKVEIYALGLEPQWLREKRKKDNTLPKKQFQKWTNSEDDLLINLYLAGVKQTEIASTLSRSPDAVNRRISRLKNAGKIYKNIMIPWTKEETDLMIEMDMRGKKDIEIAYEIGREAFHVRDHRRNLKNKGLYPVAHKNYFKATVEIERILELKSNGYTHKEIANILEIHPTTITRRLKKYNQENEYRKAIINEEFFNKIAHF